MSTLVCLIKGCSISRDKLGYVLCPDCKMNYCWDPVRGPWHWKTWAGRSTDKYRKYPFGNWIPCDHGTSCKGRRLHKNRRDAPAGFVLENEKVGTRHERFVASSRTDL